MVSLVGMLAEFAGLRVTIDREEEALTFSWESEMVGSPWNGGGGHGEVCPSTALHTTI
jgi:hypothetical protein